MPHTNRKKKSSGAVSGVDARKKFSHSKREYIDSEDGWTHVADKRWRSMISEERSSTDLQSPLADITLEEMIEEHARYRQQWENSDACVQLRTIISKMRKEEKCSVANAVCLGLGSLQALPMEWRRSSHTQLAALATIRDSLGLKSQIIMQDPRFTDIDRSFLNSTGCTVVNHPEAFEHVTQSSFVYAIHCPFQLLWNVKRKADPTLLIMNKLRDRGDEPITLIHEVHDESEAGVELLQQTDEEKKQSYLERYEETYSLKLDCEEIAFPQLRNDFSDTMIYWRRSPNTIKSNDALAMQKP